MTDAKKVIIVPMANLITGTLLDKRSIQVTFERVVNAVNEIDPDFGALLEQGKGYTLLADPVTLAMIKAQQEQFQNPNPQPQYQRQPHMGIGGYNGGMGIVQVFGIIPNGHDRVLVLSAQTLSAELPYAMGGHLVQPMQIVSAQFAAVVDEILGDAPGVNRGFVAE